MSDWNAGMDAVASMLAGNDMMQPGQDRQYKAIYEAVKNGTLSEAILNRNVKRVLEFVLKSHTYAGYQYPNETDLKGHAQVDRKIGAEGIVLLDNKEALPLAQGVKKVALYGTTSYDMVPAGMGFGSTGIGYYTVSLVEGMRKAGYTVDGKLIKQYKKHLFDEQKRLFPQGRPPFSFTPLPRAEEFLPDDGPELADDQPAGKGELLFVAGDAALGSQRAQDPDRLGAIGHGSLEMRNAADDVDAHRQPTLQLIHRVGVAQHAVLDRKSVV